MEMLALAIAAGLAMSIPPGPLGALCVTTTLRVGLRPALAVALAIATVDGLVWGSIAALGSDAVAALAPWVRRVAAGCVAVALFLVGVKVFRKAGIETDEPDPDPKGRYQPAGAALLIALGTPGTLPALIVFFATLGVDSVPIGAGGVFIAGFAWFSTVCLVTHVMRERAQRALHLVDYACGALLWLGSGAAAKFAIFP